MVAPVIMSQLFVAAMNEKHGGMQAFGYRGYGVTAGKKYDKITHVEARKNAEGEEELKATSVHAFINRETGALIKAASRNACAKRKDATTGEQVDAVKAILITEEDIANVVALSDKHGTYLYAR